jgi:hypothetical protein
MRTASAALQKGLSQHENGSARKKSGWSTLFRDPTDGRYIERAFHRSEEHGEGSSEMKYLTVKEARATYHIA